MLNRPQPVVLYHRPSRNKLIICSKWNKKNPVDSIHCTTQSILRLFQPAVDGFELFSSIQLFRIGQLCLKVQRPRSMDASSMFDTPFSIRSLMNWVIFNQVCWFDIQYRLVTRAVVMSNWVFELDVTIQDNYSQIRCLLLVKLASLSKTWDWSIKSGPDGCGTCFGRGHCHSS